MQGHGNTINYETSQPSHPWSGRTTEFDDALLQRGIVTPQQVFMAKGASESDAERLAKLRQQKDSRNSVVDVAVADTEAGSYDDDNSSDDDDDLAVDDEFMQRYREERIQEMRKEQSIIRHITRDEWTTHVNEASMRQEQWVTVALTDHYCHDRVTQELHQMRRQMLQFNHSNINWVTISASAAISNWPVERVPTLFAYRDGIKQHKWIASCAGQWPASLLQLVQEKWKIV